MNVVPSANEIGVENTDVEHTAIITVIRRRGKTFSNKLSAIISPSKKMFRPANQPRRSFNVEDQSNAHAAVRDGKWRPECVAEAGCEFRRGSRRFKERWSRNKQDRHKCNWQLHKRIAYSALCISAMRITQRSHTCGAAVAPLMAGLHII